ncbi:hypothetical protein SI65_08287 [Aspergillus cristatus]|uniref:SAC domain-containing protein n=1 Tax=Aspergillus cristatus TaxID=573508 RepID=A0A1E3B5W5_ASPCR|nr:hypothetical protein SI65_08287 [Aspergillus cristatus]
MPGLIRKLLIFAAVDGLILQPYGNGSRHNGGNNDSSSIHIEYKTSKISSFPASALSDEIEEKQQDAGLEAYGLVGLLSVAPYSFLIPITQRQQVAQIQGNPIYAVTNIALIPTSSRADAIRAIAQAKEHLLKDGASDLETDDDDDGSSIADTDTDAGETDISSTMPDFDSRHTAGSSSHARGRSITSIAEDVLGKNVRFGRFAASWLSRKTLGLPGFGTVDQDTTEMLLGKDSHSVKDAPEGQSVAGKEAKPEEENVLDEKEQIPLPEGGVLASSDHTIELLPKLLRYVKLLFASSQNFFFSYDYDITRHIGAQEPRNGHRPLHTVVDPLYFWNRHLISPFIDIDAHNHALPLMQGFVGQREFTVAANEPPSPETEEGTEHTEGQILGNKEETKELEPDAHKRDFLLTLISRRSIKRPGLRYLRRGVDDDGNTANTVETEQILSVPDWDASRNIYTYLQVRGSIPLYFSQSPYAFKPVPVLHHSTQTNQVAFERHFRDMSRRYGKVQAVSLIDKQAGELKVGEQYEKYAQSLNESGGIDGMPLGLEWFDFHHECRGMKFENVSRLVQRLDTTLDEFNYAVVQDNQIRQGQAGIIRTNCMDCLDRTGVAQSAFGQWALERQLKKEGIDVDLGGNSASQWFNTLWADNGDAISKQYSSTAALKGDYTRTRKRDYRGALNDLGLTLSRYFNNIVNDYFSQACIDYLLGNVSTQVFPEFAMEMQTADPGISMQKLRQNAIDTSCKIVISEQSEEFLGGWTMLTPRQPNTLRTLPFEESVMLLTDAAVYNCRFDWDTDKVTSFERIDLESISRINYGTYITSVLTDSQADKRSNVGLVIIYREGDDSANIRRVNTRTVQTQIDPSTVEPPSPTAAATGNDEWDLASWFTGNKQPATRFLAFKALPIHNSVTESIAARRGSATLTETDWVRCICEEIERATGARKPSDQQQRQKEEGEGRQLVEKTDIVSLEEAKKRTGILEHLIYDLKKFVWA